MLIGQYSTKISLKGRLAVPARLRKELGTSVVVTRWYEGSLGIFDKNSWEKILERALGKSILTGPTRDTERFLLGGAFEVDLDDQGRLVLPSLLREHAGLVNEIIFIGLKDRVEVWSKSRWEAREREISKKAEKLIEEVQEESNK